jgi:DNA-directed RNA polymerase subunit M/transcription elongation factor TFIIS
MALPECPQCGSDDLTSPTNGRGTIDLVCLSCDHHFSRQPRVICGRCASEDIEYGAYEGWSYDDEEPDKPAAERDWSYLEREVFRCRKCNHRWRTSGEPEPYRRPSNP